MNWAQIRQEQCHKNIVFPWRAAATGLLRFEGQFYFVSGFGGSWCIFPLSHGVYGEIYEYRIASEGLNVFYRAARGNSNFQLYHAIHVETLQVLRIHRIDLR